ncbi:calponin-homology domain-containing protein [Caerostris extrusa]|uniref:Calponin-homology domain-containing protein n=1 Tax=Caerostris extrusa TaxID=172846 RepID=A0AAV4VNM6_CAEEX|nr:calponin-homology domain-containing protein [Caerostris extrusa]
MVQKPRMLPSQLSQLKQKPIVERKRRKSDLVVMWMSLWDLTGFLATEIWTALLGILEITNMFFNSEEVWEIRIWLKQYLDHVPDDFSQSWRDGILFCKLLNKLQPGCYPGVNKLDSNFGVRNLSQAFYILETQFDISPKITVEDIVTCRDGSDSKFLDLLLQLKRKKFDEEKEIKTSVEPNEIGKENSNESTESKNCIAKGTGLMVGFVGRIANFVVFFSSLSDLDLVVEIKGPCKSSCCERITNRSPKIKNTIKPWKPNSPHIFIRSPSNPEDESLSITENRKTKSESEKQYIPLEYEIKSNKINFSYVPVTRGCHRIAILANGEHVTDSPYLVTVEPTIRIPTNDSALPIKSALRPASRQQSEEDQPKKQSVRFQEPEEKERKERLGKILKRKVLRYIVKIDGKDVVVDADSIGNLATSLLKMDYEFQKRPLCRRNSWGFVGDAERKVSFIRQFCIDLDELEAQSAKMQRSNSLSFTTTYKSPLKQRISYECEDILQHTILETVTEGTTLDLNESTQVQREEDDVFCIPQ